MYNDEERFHELLKFLFKFNFNIEKEVEISEKSFLSVDNQPLTATDSKLRAFSEPGLRVTISYNSLFRLLDMLRSKGYYHDDLYQIRMQEEELIMENPSLKQLHDQYKTMLYLMCGEDYNNG